MRRREFVRGVVAASFAPGMLVGQQTQTSAPPPPAPVPWTLGLSPKTPLPETEVAEGLADAEPKFFSPTQMAVLLRLCDVLLPPTDGRPGAVDAGTAPFLDFLIGSSPVTRQRVYTGGLGWLDAEAQRRSRKPFAKLTDAEADAVLRPWLRTWMSDHPPTEPHADFVNIAHDEIRTATMNSKAWKDAPASESWNPAGPGLYWSPIEPNLQSRGTERVAPHVLAAPKSAHTMPEYPR